MSNRCFAVASLARTPYGGCFGRGGGEDAGLRTGGRGGKTDRCGSRRVRMLAAASALQALLLSAVALRRHRVCCGRG